MLLSKRTPIMYNNHMQLKDKKPHKEPISLVGRTGQAWLELRGTILLYHEAHWTGRALMYIPLEWVNVMHRSRWKGRLAPIMLVYVVLGAVCTACLIAYETRLIEVPESARTYILPLTLGVCILAGGLLLPAFLRRQPTTLLRVDTAGEPIRIEFWHAPGKNATLDELMARIENVQAHVEDRVPYRIPMSHTRLRAKPLRIVLMWSAIITAALYMPVRLAAVWLDIPALNWVLLGPVVVYLGRYALGRALLRFTPDSYRHAVLSYERGDYEEAVDQFDDLEQTFPDRLEPLILMYQVYLARNDFDAAGRVCTRMDEYDPDLADELMQEVWGLRRIHERMSTDGS